MTHEQLFLHGPDGGSVVVQYFSADPLTPSKRLCAYLRDFYAWKVRMYDELAEPTAGDIEYESWTVGRVAFPE